MLRASAEPEEGGEFRQTLQGKVSGSSKKLLLVKGLPCSMDEEYLMATFKPFGHIRWVRMASSREVQATDGTVSGVQGPSSDDMA
jgi:hypothetical protein